MKNIITPVPEYNSKLTNTILALERLQGSATFGDVPEKTFLQLKSLFHVVEALSSARIENNHTTLAAYVMARTYEPKKFDKDEQYREITNLVNALDFIDTNIYDSEIDSMFLSELHRIVVKGLKKEGDDRAGSYRKHDVGINNSKHTPPSFYDVPDLMRDLISYINEPVPDSESLLRVAIAHHRFVYIHPYGNGNGRTVRLLTYAMLCKKGFITAGEKRLFNPAAVFAADRNKYYDYLMKADEMTEKSLLEWCEYFLGGLKDEIEKTQKLTNWEFVSNKILTPTIAWALNREIITPQESSVLSRIVRKTTVKMSDIKDLWEKDTPRLRISRFIAKMRKDGFIEPVHNNAREYTIRFDSGRLTYGILKQMENEGMLPVRVDDYDSAEK